MLQRGTVAITHTAVSADANYDGTAISNLTVTVIDNDTPQVTRVWTQPGDRHLVVNWLAADKATGYKVQWKAPGDNYNTYSRSATIRRGFDHDPHHPEPHQRHRIHGAGDRHLDGPHRRPSVGGGDGYADGNTMTT